MTQQPNLIILCGLPGSGKTTYSNSDEFKYHVRLSSDDYIDSIAQKLGKTYNDVFSKTVIQANKMFFEGIKYFSETNYNVLIDRTNLTRKSRRKIIRKFINHSPTIVFFDVAINDILKRNTRSGKVFSENLLMEMYERLEIPNESEANIVTLH
jgi:tRNA uridine 5-carbamoylmethylation protein Kti12